jgi:hypothetical protein
VTEREIYQLRVADHLVDAHKFLEEELAGVDLTARHRRDHRRRRRKGRQRGWDPHRLPPRRWPLAALSIDLPAALPPG